jgi:hypothetical protein
MVTGLIVGFASSVETLLPGLDEAVGSESCWPSNSPGCHVEGAQPSDARTVNVRHTIMVQKTRCGHQVALWGYFIALVALHRIRVQIIDGNGPATITQEILAMLKKSNEEVDEAGTL